MKQTANYGFWKPDPEDYAKIETLNENTDKIDEAIKAVANGAAPAYTTKSMNDCTTLKEIFDLFGYNYSVRLTGGIGQQEATNLRTLLGSELGVAFHTNYLGVRAELVSDRTILLTAVDATSGDDIADGYIYFNAQMTVGNWTGWRTSDYRIVDGVVEWFNPPMELGVEYRTTERYLGKPVYVKAIDFGAMPNATTKSVTVSSGAGVQILRATGKVSDGRVLPYIVGDTNDVNAYLYAIESAVAAVTRLDWSAKTAVVTCWYTKG